MSGKAWFSLCLAFVPLVAFLGFTGTLATVLFVRLVLG